MINSIFNPYARGIVKIAPIKESIDTGHLTPQNINLGSYALDNTVTYDTVGTYYIKNSEGDGYTAVTLPEEFVADTQYYTYQTDLLSPLKDIIDICGVNPSEIVYSKNTNSSEESGRTQGSAETGVYLNMHKDILGRVRDITMTFPPIFKEKYQSLDNLFMSLVENVSETEDEPDYKYIIWYYVEISLPESDEPIKDIYYVGDSSFNDVRIEYRNIVTKSDDSGNPIEISAKPFAKGLKINLIGKCAIKGLTNITET